MELVTEEVKDIQQPLKVHVLDVWEKKIGLRTITVNTDLMEDEVYDSHMVGQKDDVDDGRNMLLSEGDRMVAIVDKSEKKVKGRNFAYEVNGLQIFAMGADYIPEDNILTRQNRARTVYCFYLRRSPILIRCVYGVAVIFWMISFMIFVTKEVF